MKSFKIYLESSVDLEDKVRDYLLGGGRGRSRKQVTGKSLKDNMKKYDRDNQLETLISNLITDGEIEFKLDGKKKVTRMKDFYKHWTYSFKTDPKKDPKVTILTQKNTFRWIGGN